MTQTKLIWMLLFTAFISNHSNVFAQEVKHGSVVTETLVSTILQENRIGLDPNRSIKIYLPPGYTGSRRSYPVVYYLHNIFWSPAQMFEDGNLVSFLERGFSNEVVKEFILVAADFSTPTTGSIYGNSQTSGRWMDFIIEELVPFIDSKFRTLPNRNSRALAGDFFGGYGALKLAMMHADIFSVSYALHPVATGSGPQPWGSIPVDWKKIHQAKSWADLPNGREQIFVSMAQAFLPNPNRPPFYCDFWVEFENNEPKPHPVNTRKAQVGFLLDETLDKYASNLRTMRGIAFDWGRFDPTKAHVLSNRAFSQKLEDLGIEHEAEEYNGNQYNRNWTENGRFYARVLPFLARNLVFED
ncbi:alpha/beta hydrolase-fold protein [Algoriphagus sp. D3-2-R+10]|uniref:alpha/beta hydrolase-fold protein n=1 Tax=Algoriphagus aurantiacus TaxID=3103948 RepID=UPI002B3EA331|nr:alpha/beta hydrolase-fold protein [Algoriphagus sp. D3-2-R+10]MEB2776396.1 alpha/beta hydrolase-fold protein [Algoriphagus sp. D3-2-R+10]